MEKVERQAAQKCNMRFVQHGNASGMICCCPLCGEPYPVDTHIHACMNAECAGYREDIWPHWHINPEIKLCHGECQKVVVN